MLFENDRTAFSLKLNDQGKALSKVPKVGWGDYYAECLCPHCNGEVNIPDWERNS